MKLLKTILISSLLFLPVVASANSFEVWDEVDNCNTYVQTPNNIQMGYKQLQPFSGPDIIQYGQKVGNNYQMHFHIYDNGYRIDGDDFIVTCDSKFNPLTASGTETDTFTGTTYTTFMYTATTAIIEEQ